MTDSRRARTRPNLPGFAERDASLPERVDEELLAGFGAAGVTWPDAEATSATVDYEPAAGSILELLPPPPAPPGVRPLSEVIQEMRDEERW